MQQAMTSWNVSCVKDGNTVAYPSRPTQKYCRQCVSRVLSALVTFKQIQDKFSVVDKKLSSIQEE